MATKVLSAAQKRAYDKLTGAPQSASRLGESLSTLDALVRNGCARKRVESGSGWFPREHTLYYRIA